MSLRDVSGAADTRAEREDRLLAASGYHKVDPLEREADKLLAEQDHDLLLRLVESTEAIREGMETLKLPSNDPEYLRRLQTSEATRNAIANQLTQIDLVPDGDKTYLGVGRFTNHEALELARKLADHFETKIRQYDPR
jgi:hypothetical protein